MAGGGRLVGTTANRRRCDVDQWPARVCGSHTCRDKMRKGKRLTENRAARQTRAWWRSRQARALLDAMSGCSLSETSLSEVLGADGGLAGNLAGRACRDRGCRWGGWGPAMVVQRLSFFCLGTVGTVL